MSVELVGARCIVRSFVVADATSKFFGELPAKTKVRAAGATKLLKTLVDVTHQQTTYLA
jgi:hypothetical protein